MNIKMLKAAIAGLVLSASGFANAGLVEFEDIITSGTYLSTSGPDTVDGMVFSYSGSAYFMENYHTTDSAAPVDPTGSLFTYQNTFITMTKDGGSSFDLNSFDAGIYLNQADALINVVGTYNIGGTVSEAFNISPNAWNTFTFSDTWSDLASVTFQMIGSSFIQYDNIAYNNQSVDVPEPSTLAIFALAILGLASRKVKKQ